MINNSKILTVSYGTFSCTLEGFDDSFGTMKAIAEYFRDLAADDRYFGAEPPQPDAEMLARIAEKEVARRVEARQQDGQIVLSAVQPDAAPVAPAAAAATALPAAIEALSVDDEAPVGEQAAVDIEDAEAAAILKAVEDVPEVAVDEAPAEEEVALSLDPVEETVEAPVEDDAVIAFDPAATEAAEVNDIVPGQPDEEVEAFFASAEEEAEEVTAEDITPAPAPVAPPDDDSIAAKLQRIRAVVSQQAAAQEDDDFVEDEHAESDHDAAPAVVHDLVADARADIEDALAADDAATEEAEDEDELSALLGRVRSENAAAEAEADEADTAEATEDTVSNLFDEEEAAADDAAEPEAEVEPAPRARVIKVKRAELEAAIEKGDLEEVDADADAETDEADAETDARSLDDLAPAKQASTALSPEAEDELARELSALSDDFEAEEDTTDHADNDAEAPARPAAARAQLPTLDDAENSDVNRLLDESDHQMDQPEAATRRDAFAHLKAAVAARKADKTMDAEEAARKGDGAYRDDLAEVVRPRRPATGEARRERPSAERPAPLKLVAEQRIDIETPKPAGPVRPRRVAAMANTAEAADPDGESFSDFAAEMGAHSLPELLEAAAAYLSFVEGRDQFSRPQLMKKVRQAGGEEGFSREESLRSFGQLLRSGKIEKIRGGRFTVSDDIGFRPDQRAAG